MKFKSILVLSTVILLSIFLSGCWSEDTSGGNSINSNGGNQNEDYSNSPLSYFFHTFDMNVSGAAYLTEDYANNTATLHTSAGALSGGLTINGNGTYVWNSTWEGRVIQGNWEETDDPDYPIVLLKGEDGRDWKVAKDGERDIIIWDQNSISKNGHPIE